MSSDCTLCPLHEVAGSVCLSARGKGDVPTRVLFVGEAPTNMADAKGTAFKDYEGNLLSDIIKQMGLDSFRVTYAVKCYPGTDRGPKVAHMRKCLPYLADEIAKYQPEYIVPMGNAALRAVTSLWNDDKGLVGITKYAGRVMDLDEPDWYARWEEKGKEEVYEAPDMAGHPIYDAKVFPMLNAKSIVKSKDNETRFQADFTRFSQELSGKDVTPAYPKLTTQEAVDWMREVRECDEVDYFSIDLETTALNPRFGEIRTVAIRAEDQTVWFEWTPALANPLCALLISGKVMVAHNAPFELKWLLHHVAIPTLGERDMWKHEWRVGDSLVMHHLIDENAKHGLSLLAKTHTDIGGYDDEMEAAKAKAGDGAFTTVPVDVLGNYNAGDADVCYRLYEQFYDEIAEDKRLFRYYWNFQAPALWDVAWAEYNGRRVDPDAVKGVRAKLETDIEEAFDAICDEDWERWAADHEGEEINFNSARQLAKFLTEYKGVPLTAETATGELSCAEAALLHHTAKFPWLKTYLRWKKSQTLLNNYLGRYRTQDDPKGKGILGFVAPDGLLYGSYLLHGTVTGRLASRSPNLQNFHKDLRKIVRSRFPGGSIMESDYSQLELRIISWQADCPVLLMAYLRNEDIHTLTALTILSRTEEEGVTPEERKNFGKVPNFGLTYGMRAKRFAMQFQRPLKEAKFTVKRWYEAYPEIPDFVSLQHRRATRFGKLRSTFGRVRHIPEAMVDTSGLDWDDPRKKAQIHALLGASNFDTQGTANDINTKAAGWTRREAAKRGMKSVFIGLTHDSQTWDVYPGEEEELAAIMDDCMVRQIHAKYPQIGVNLAIDTSIGDSWGDLD